MHQLILPVGTSVSAGIAQSALSSGGRFLLMVATTLFLCYLLFMFGAVMVSSLADWSRSVRHRSAHHRSAGADPRPEHAQA